MGNAIETELSNRLAAMLRERHFTTSKTKSGHKDGTSIIDVQQEPNYSSSPYTYFQNPLAAPPYLFTFFGNSGGGERDYPLLAGKCIGQVSPRNEGGQGL